MNAAQRLRSAEIETARLEAELLLGAVLGVDRLELIRLPEQSVSLEHLAAFEALLHRRERREPLPYLTGKRAFLDFELEVGPGVLIPRPETEDLVLSTASRLENIHDPLVVDVGLGSGAVAIGLARICPSARVIGVELSEAAIATARNNVRVLGLEERIRIVQGDLLNPAPPDWKGKVNLVVSNPPYIPDEAIAGLQPEVRDYEPRLALCGGPEGLDIIERLARESKTWLAVGGTLAMEIGQGQSARVRDLLQVAGYADVVILPDLSGIERIALARRPTPLEPVLPDDHRAYSAVART